MLWRTAEAGQETRRQPLTQHDVSTPGPFPDLVVHSSPVTAPRGWILAIAVVMTMAGCSSSPKAASPKTASPTSAPASSSTPTARPGATATSAFCLDLPAFHVALIAYSSEVGAAIEGEPLDFKELRRKAVLIAGTGKAMQPSAPPDIAEHLRTVLKAIDTSASRLKPGAKVRDVVDPVYGERNRPAFDAVNNYDCGTASP